MKVLVTGGTGFIGKPLVRALSLNHSVTAFSRVEDIGLPDGVRIVNGDVRKKSDLRRAFSSTDVVYHLAACNDEDDPNIFGINVLGTEKVVELCREKKVKQLVFVSSAGVTGENKLPAKEHSHYRPKTKFDKSKVGAERLIKDSGLPYTIIRSPAVIGPNAAWAGIFDAIKSGHPIVGTGRNKFHVAHRDDVVGILLEVLNNKKALNHVFNIASKDVMSYGEFYDTVCRAMRAKNRYKYRNAKIAGVLSRLHWYKTSIQGVQTRPHMSKTYINMATRNCVLSIRKAKEVLGFEPYYTTPMAIDITLRDIRAPEVVG